MADYNTKPQSRSEEILRALIDGDQYNKKAQSRIEYLLKQLITVLDGKADLDEDGLIPLSELPPVVFEHMMEVVDDTARFALTTDDVQNGDYVYVDSSNIMYFVIDDTKLDREAGYKPVAAGIAAKAVGDKNGNDITTTYQPKIDSQHKLDADLVDDSTSTNKFVTVAEKAQIATTAFKVSGIGDSDINYIEMQNEVRLYISDTEPTGATGPIPEGAIGVGW